MSSHEELLTSIDSELRSQMPEECYDHFKKFNLCKLDFEAEYKNKHGYKAFVDFQTDPYSRVAGCSNEYNSYTKCHSEFVNRYIDLKNYVGEIEGKPIPYDRKELDKDLKKNMSVYNFGLNKF